MASILKRKIQDMERQAGDTVTSDGNEGQRKEMGNKPATEIGGENIWLKGNDAAKEIVEK